MMRANPAKGKLRRAFVSAALFAALTVLIGCDAGIGDTAQAPNGITAVRPVTLTLMANQEWTGKPILTKAISLYEQQTSNRIELQELPIDTADTLISKRVAIGEITDIVMHFGGAALSDLRPERNFVDLSGEAWVSDLIEAVKPRLMKDGKLYGLPLWEAATSGMIYNKRIFERLGLRVPTNQSEFFDVCRKLKEAGIVPVYLASKDVWPLMPQFGIDYAVAKTPGLVEALNTNKANMSDVPAILDVVEWYRKMYASGFFGDDSASNNWDGLPAALHGGDYAMVMAWDTYLYSDLEAKYPGSAQDFGMMPLFVGGADAKLFEGPNAAMLMVNKNGKHVDEAVDFIRFLANPEVLNEVYRDIKSGTYFRSVTTNRPTPQYVENQAIIDALTFPSATPFMIGYSQYEMGKWVQQAMTGAITARDALSGMDAYREQIALDRGIPEFKHPR
ncbi:ABC transporter substrate-binding protein [Cohnella yongneupensis]|uniref:ABC transporter substrate-binding protein n=1 Tax=Cohnella yongneupensis TaxID=425006 RepID=A0ABW0QX52_9BACL